MDYTQTLQPLINSLWYLIPLAILEAAIKSPWFKGKAGVLVVNLSTKLFLNKARHHLIKNIAIPTDGRWSAFQHIISCLPATLLETRNIKAWISWKTKHKWWIQGSYMYLLMLQHQLTKCYRRIQTLQSHRELMTPS